MRRRSLIAVTVGLGLAGGLSLWLFAVRPSPPNSTRTAGDYTVRAVPGTVRAGQTVHLSLTVLGPARYEDCKPVSFWVKDRSGVTVWTAVQFWACPLLRLEQLAPGQRVAFQIDWPTSGLPPGRYFVHGFFNQRLNPQSGSRENLPVVTVDLT